jgi:heterotetrameric sarcosine oxidase delta subunit
MKIMVCPLNGPRNIAEFQYLGPVRPAPDPETASDATWARYLFSAPNARAVTLEWWRHTPSNYVFLAERHLGSGELLRTFDPAEAP